MSAQPGARAAGLPRGRLVLIVSALILPTIVVSLDPRFVAAAGDDPAAGYDQYCIACHGPDARGIDNLGVDLVASQFVARSSQAGLVAFLRAGRLADDPASVTGRPMPGFAWVAESELASIADYLKSRNSAPPLPPES